jgi:hypothetical protein
LWFPPPLLTRAQPRAAHHEGTWEFTGKDNTGLVWSGTLSIEKLDPARSDPNKYHSLCRFEVQSSDKQSTEDRQVLSGWDPGACTVSFGKSYPAVNVYTAIPSGDGKVFMQGKWTGSRIVRGQAGVIIRSGEWSAKLSDR